MWQVKYVWKTRALQPTKKKWEEKCNVAIIMNWEREKWPSSTFNAWQHERTEIEKKMRRVDWKWKRTYGTAGAHQTLPCVIALRSRDDVTRLKRRLAREKKKRQTILCREYSRCSYLLSASWPPILIAPPFPFRFCFRFVLCACWRVYRPFFNYSRST